MKRIIIAVLVAVFALSASAQELNVGSFNIRNDRPFKEGDKRTRDYAHYDGWNDRKQYVCDMINLEAFDIFGSQSLAV